MAEPIESAYAAGCARLLAEPNESAYAPGTLVQGLYSQVV